MAPKNNRHFASQVRETMTRLGLTQANVTERGGPSDTTLRKIIDGEPVGISTATLQKLDTAFGWEPGSAAATLAGGEPITSGVIRGRDGQIIQRYRAIGGADQEDLEQLRLATIVMDARDLVRTQAGPLMSALDIVLNEAVDLVTRLVARRNTSAEYVDDVEMQNAAWYIDQVRAGGSIRRQGSNYVTVGGLPTRESHWLPDRATSTQSDAPLEGGEVEQVTTDMLDLAARRVENDDKPE
ncbi:LamD-like protein [Mycobacterium phage Sbash]|uniref:LamD-like protein n=1 Tax=Mycobacterium phage Sbash TaxID=1567475 RepID=A0A0A7RVP4_9CAUD|nr:LamD-like protein [Mycobacterium phage Sbash]AJA43344.1 LamD-like protein [Mycobacterium phage Sbash]